MGSVPGGPVTGSRSPLRVAPDESATHALDAPHESRQSRLERCEAAWDEPVAGFGNGRHMIVTMVPAPAGHRDVAADDK